ncbi:MAG: sigma-70 family RNA polymerase sigma factor [Nocardioides sp.]|nr:sigma-70 family RNA polymerase sigma factor [Nocardioides sp.]
MSSTTTSDAPGDAELISAVRGGDVDAYGELFARHVGAARRLGRQLVSAGDVDDLVSDAFAKVLAVLQRGGGPDLAFRAYLLTAMRRLHIDRIRAGSRLRTTDDLTPYDPGVPFHDTAVAGFESAATAKAFASLPERWQMVLWHTEVEGAKPAEVAELLGMSANSVSALAYRAREGLRQAYLSMHAQETANDACAWTRDNLGAYVRNGTSRRDSAKVEAHLGECRCCTAIYLELTEVNSRLSLVLGPLVLGSAAAGYLSSTAGGLGLKAGVLALAGRARDAVVSHAPATAVAGVAVTAVAVGSLVGLPGGDDSTPAAAPDAPASSRSAPQDPARPATPRRTTSPAAAPVLAGAGATTGPTTEPTSPTEPTEPTTQPTTEPTTEPTPEPTGTADPEPEGDEVTVGSRTSNLGGLVWGIAVTVDGVDPGTRATLEVSAGSPAVALTLDPRCGPLRSGWSSCAVTGPATYRFTAVSLPKVSTTLTFTVGDSSSTVRLTP